MNKEEKEKKENREYWENIDQKEYDRCMKMLVDAGFDLKELFGEKKKEIKE